MKRFFSILIALTLAVVFTSSIYAVPLPAETFDVASVVSVDGVETVDGYYFVTCPFCGEVMGLTCTGSITRTETISCTISSHSTDYDCDCTQYYAGTDGTCNNCYYHKGVVKPAWPFETEHAHYQIHIPNGGASKQIWSNCKYD